MSTSKLQIGTHVIAVTPERVAVNALVEVVHKGTDTAEEHKEKYGQWPCINLIYLQPDPNMKDQYGRQKGHMSSCSHGNVQGVPQGYCWFFPEEVPNVEIGEVVFFDKPVSE